VKPRIQANFVRASKQPAEEPATFTSKAAAVSFAIYHQYTDVVHTCLPYPTASSAMSPEEDSAVLHVVQHLLKKMDTVKHNNDKLLEGTLAASKAMDQGFVRPVALVLAPLRCVAFTAVLRLLQLAQRETR
jgi:hypothetical protein